VASGSKTGEIRQFHFGPGWPTTPIEGFIDLLWYTMVLFPTITFMFRYLEQPTLQRALESSAFALLLVADRIAV
jgi:hypothetical protein